MNGWCPYCFGELRTDGACPQCASEKVEPRRDDLAASTSIDARYLIGRALGRGGFGVTYLGWQQMPSRRVAIKEYLPQTVAKRKSDGTVVPSSRNVEPEFRQGLVAFGEEAQRLADFQGQPHIVNVFDFVHAYGTAYMVMEYCPGQTALEYLENYGGRLSFEDALSIIDPVLEALHILHQRNVFHRDVSPTNILLTEQGIKLIDFGAARTALADRSVSFSAILNMAYAPPEQYSRKGTRQGPWTDVYATAATLYHMLTGAPPPTAMDRLEHDDLVPPSAKARKLPAHADRAILAALALDTQGRTPSAAAFRSALTGSSGKSQPSPVKARTSENAVQPPVIKKSLATSSSTDRTWWVLAAILVFFVLLPIGSLAAWWILAANPRIVSFNVDPERTVAGGQVKLSWQTSGATKVAIAPTEDGESLPAQGELVVSPNGTTEYILTAAGPGGTSASRSKIVVIDRSEARTTPAARPAPAPASPPAPPPAASHRDRGEEAKTALRLMIGGWMNRYPGYEEIRNAPGEMKHEEAKNWQVQLEAGNEYVFLGAGDTDAKDVDFILRAKGDDMVRTKDTDNDATPVVQISPEASGLYVLTIQMATCTNAPCHVHVVLLAKPKSAPQ